MRIILASASPRRRELLSGLGIGEFEVCPSHFDEGSVTERDPVERVRRIAEGKASSLAGQLPETQRLSEPLVIAADTLVYLDGEILGKPRDEDDAFRMLTALSGREHHVATGVAVTSRGVLESGVEVTAVRFRHLSAEEIRRYIATGEPMDKAGAYGIQRLGGLLVLGITGDYFNVVGLPVCRLGRMLRKFGVELL